MLLTWTKMGTTLKTAQRIGLTVPLISLTALTSGISLIDAADLRRGHTDGERAVTFFVCLKTGLSLGVSISIALDRRINELP